MHEPSCLDLGLSYGAHSLESESSNDPTLRAESCSARNTIEMWHAKRYKLWLYKEQLFLQPHTFWILIPPRAHPGSIDGSRLILRWCAPPVQIHPGGNEITAWERQTPLRCTD